jgi:transcriptional regulator GlxA family with amidase domain
METWNTAILLFEGVEVLDFAGPFEVFSRTRLQPGAASRRSEEGSPFRVFTVAARRGPVRATGGLVVLADHGFEDAPHIDLLVVPGGFGSRAAMKDAATLEWIRGRAARARRVASVCTGALVLAEAGLLDGRRATTHWGALDLLEGLGRGIVVDREARMVDDGVISSAGVASGMDMAFSIVEQRCGRAVADDTAKYIEYRRVA